MHPGEPCRCCRRHQGRHSGLAIEPSIFLSRTNLPFVYIDGDRSDCAIRAGLAPTDQRMDSDRGNNWSYLHGIYSDNVPYIPARVLIVESEFVLTPWSLPPARDQPRRMAVSSATNVKPRPFSGSRIKGALRTRTYGDSGRPWKSGPPTSWRNPRRCFSRLADCVSARVSSLLMRGGRREGAGRPKGSGDGPTAQIRSVSMLPEVWAKLDQMRGSTSRGVWLSARICRDFNAIGSSQR